MRYRSFLGIMVREENMEFIPGNISKKHDTFGISQVVQCVQRINCRRGTERNRHGPNHKDLLICHSWGGKKSKFLQLHKDNSQIFICRFGLCLDFQVHVSNGFPSIHFNWNSFSLSLPIPDSSKS